MALACIRIASLLHVLVESLDNLGLVSPIRSSKTPEANSAEAGDFISDKIAGGCSIVCDRQEIGWYSSLLIVQFSMWVMQVYSIICCRALPS